MTGIDYCIIGAEVDETRDYLHPDGSFSSTPTPGAEALNVEFIGRMMVRLSQQGAAALTAKDREAVRRALRVKELDHSKTLTDAQKADILANTTVQITFETRTSHPGKPDANLRILVVPSDNTLAIADKALSNSPHSPNDPPPLTYELDKKLMLASLKGKILEMLGGFAINPEPGWTTALQTALVAHMTAALDEESQFFENNGDPHIGPKTDILNSPLRAFHRSVGIYATNMCR